MTPIPKLAAALSVTGAVVGDALLFVWAAIQQAPPPTVGDIGAAGATGAATSVAILWAWKGITDRRIEKLENGKADKDLLDAHGELLNEVRLDIKKLLEHRGDHS